MEKKNELLSNHLKFHSKITFLFGNNKFIFTKFMRYLTATIFYV